MSEGSRRHDFGPTLMREASVGSSEKWLKDRSEWLISSSKVQKYLAEKIVFTDKLASQVEKGVKVLSIGSGKGHELDEMDSVLRKIAKEV